jgi:tetratricopeptide (TPR) repeat protein
VLQQMHLQQTLQSDSPPSENQARIHRTPQDRSGRYEEAVSDFTAAIELLPSSADFHFNRGYCRRKQVRPSVSSLAGEGCSDLKHL